MPTPGSKDLLKLASEEEYPVQGVDGAVYVFLWEIFPVIACRYLQ